MKSLLRLLALGVFFAAPGSLFAQTISSPGGGCPGGSNTQVSFNDGGVCAGNAAIVFNKTTGVLAQAPAAPTTLGGSIINFNAVATASLPTIPHSNSLRIVAADSDFAAAYLQSWGLRSIINGYSSGGTAATPTATQAGAELFRISGRGYGATGYTGSISALSYFAHQNITDSAQGGWAGVRVAPDGSVAGGSASAPPLTVGFSNAGGLIVGKDYFSYSAPNTASYATEPGNGVGLFEGGVAFKGATNADLLTLKGPAGTGTPTITLPFGTTDFSATGGASQVVRQSTAGGALTVSALTNSDVGLGSVTNDVQAKASIYPNTAYPGQLMVKATIDFSQGNTDFPITIPLPTGISRYFLQVLRLSGASASLSGATASLWSAAGGTGTNLISSGTAITLAVTSENTAANAQNIATAITVQSETINFTTLYFRVQATAAGTATFSIFFLPAS